ncbi:hypothetical protein [Frigoribacterium sp. MEB024]|uniref:hypothetical protein n=1 Tax=Frigoribacterium sp. MEB024 TaxID=1589899 RepID=UPI0005B8BCFD|nr:hypothetical protein [Frigoribacterium sp. MEB024]KIU02500.1 hypothetical protein SZ60_11530 [Frigoribacterium sp. MEB024]
MDIDGTLDIVTAHRAADEIEEARVLLRALAEQAPRDLMVRMALTDFARAEGHVDQAARWGIVIDGYTTAHERRVFWRVLTGITTLDRLRTYLRLEPGADLPRDLAAIMPPHLGGTHVDGFYDECRYRDVDTGPSLKGLGDAALLPMWFSTPIPAVAAGLSAWQRDSPSPALAVVAAALALVSTAAIVGWIVYGVRNRTVGLPLVAVGLLVAGIWLALHATSLPVPD